VNLRWTILLVSTLLAGAAEAAPGDKTDVVRDLAGRVGPMVGPALACRDIARPRIQVVIDKFTAVITQFSSSEAERADLTQLLDRNIADGRTAVTSGRMDCRLAERQLADLEQSIARQPLPAAAPPPATVAPSFAAAEAADYVSLEGFISANILIEAIKRTGPQLDTEKLIDVLENMRNLDLGLGVPLNFGRAEHQASHKIWGTAIDENGKYQAIELE
jgi:Periplasmic binding protein